eukprot:COSAG03_NODE_19652_length_332_cov_1.918455_1_plen_63_part_10
MPSGVAPVPIMDEPAAMAWPSEEPVRARESQREPQRAGRRREGWCVLILTISVSLCLCIALCL